MKRQNQFEFEVWCLKYVAGQAGLERYLVVELSDVLLYVRQQASEGELLDELSDVVVVIQGQTRPVAPCATRRALWISRTFLQVGVNGTEGVQASWTAHCVQLERMAVQAVGCSICVGNTTYYHNAHTFDVHSLHKTFYLSQQPINPDEPGGFYTKHLHSTLSMISCGEAPYDHIMTYIHVVNKSILNRA